MSLGGLAKSTISIHSHPKAENNLAAATRVPSNKQILCLTVISVYELNICGFCYFSFGIIYIINIWRDYEMFLILKL